MSKTSSKTGHPGQMRQVRRLDHAVLPVGDLDSARRRFTALGFSVAPDARHPFGTENACVFLADGFYLEPLAIGHRETCEAAARKGNVFVGRDQAWRFRNGSEGFEALAFASDDAAADHARFSRAGIGGGKPLGFSRVFDDGKGNRQKASFKLAFAGDWRSPDAWFFTCERLGNTLDRSKPAKHKNGVTGLNAVVMSEANPSDFQYLLQEASGQREVHSDSLGMSLSLGNARMIVYNDDGMRAWFGNSADLQQRGLKLRALVLSVRSIEKTADLLQANGISIRMLHQRAIVDPAPGQGAMLVFEERR